MCRHHALGKDLSLDTWPYCRLAAASDHSVDLVGELSIDPSKGLASYTGRVPANVLTPRPSTGMARFGKAHPVVQPTSRRMATLPAGPNPVGFVLLELAVLVLDPIVRQHSEPEMFVERAVP